MNENTVGEARLPAPEEKQVVTYAGETWTVEEGSLEQGQLSGEVRLTRPSQDEERRRGERCLEVAGKFTEHRCLEGVMVMHSPNQPTVTLFGRVCSKGEEHVFGSRKPDVRYEGLVEEKSPDNESDCISHSEKDGYYSGSRIELCGRGKYQIRVFDQTKQCLVLKESFQGVFQNSTLMRGRIEVHALDMPGKYWRESGSFTRTIKDVCTLHTQDALNQELRQFYDTSGHLARADKGRFVQGVLLEGARFERLKKERADHTKLVYFLGKFEGKLGDEQPEDTQGLMMYETDPGKGRVFFGASGGWAINELLFCLVNFTNPAHMTFVMMYQFDTLWSAELDVSGTFRITRMPISKKSEYSRIMRLLIPEQVLPKLRSFLNELHLLSERPVLTTLPQQPAPQTQASQQPLEEAASQAVQVATTPKAIPSLQKESLIVTPAAQLREKYRQRNVRCIVAALKKHGLMQEVDTVTSSAAASPEVVSSKTSPQH